jgi:uncharacterized protein (TIGR00299 family) protein
VFARLAQAEAGAHGIPAEDVHFHEVGALDALADVVGACAGLHHLGLTALTASPVTLGGGTARSAHGTIPVPVPAVLALLEGAPVTGGAVQKEMCTPTGAALLAAHVSAYGPLPPMRIAATGFGAGRREIDGLPNMTQVIIGADARLPRTTAGQPVVQLEANVDDATGEVLAHAVAALLEAGAHDAWITPIVMKKGRPAHTVSALADVAFAEQVARVLQAETGTLGVRGQVMQRWPAEREDDEVTIDGLPVRVKRSPGRIKVEHDDAARVARRRGLPLREVLFRAEAEVRRIHPELGPGPNGDAS